MELLQAVAFLYDKDIIHRDIKPTNILLQCASLLYIRLADFGLSKIIEDTTQTFTGTQHYMAPEMTKGHAYTKKVDVYAVGMTLYEVIGGVMSSTSSITTFRREVQKQLQERFIRTDVYDLLSKMLNKDPVQRLTATQCLDDPYITRPPCQITPVARFRAVLANTSEEQQLKVALNRQRKAKSPFEQRLPAQRDKIRGTTGNGPVYGGKIMKFSRYQKAARNA